MDQPHRPVSRRARANTAIALLIAVVLVAFSAAAAPAAKRSPNRSYNGPAGNAPNAGVEFGAHYVSSAVVPDGTDPPPVDDRYSDYVPSATPGCRAPHVWLGRDGVPGPAGDDCTLGFFFGGRDWGGGGLEDCGLGCWLVG